MKQSKMQMLKSSIAQKETSQCTFQPDLSKTSPLRRPPSSVIIIRSPSPNKAISNLNQEPTAPSYLSQYKEKCEYSKRTQSNQKCKRLKHKVRNRSNIRKNMKENANPTTLSLIGSLTERLCMNQHHKNIMNINI